MKCDSCQPKQKGYTVIFSNVEDMEKIQYYFIKFAETEYKMINTSTIWLIEPHFFSLMDYVCKHLKIEQVYAVESDPLNPFEKIEEKQPLTFFNESRKSSWIDDVIEENRLITYFQPIIGVHNNEPVIIGHELLSRGMEKSGEIIPPYKLFEAARIHNRLFSLDRACRMQAVRQAASVDDVLVFINFIPTAIYVPEHCLASTFQLINELEIQPHQIVFEVVETDEVKDIHQLKRILDYYRSHGFLYALDDVGSGYNDIDKLMALKPDIVKLAIEYTNGVSSNVEKQKMAKLVLKSCRQIGAKALAEGVEKEEDYVFLKKMGYDLFQGYFFSKPLPTPLQQEKLTSMLRTH
ncbi:EAL domain-containing protein [Niallia nealsonii]|uniref:EAL domain-containing protein n=1 Tax=Niallia nealsonii TaxID=115979 RepID=A0A2N0Z2Y0_9BACI|nr:EAL domain-containing protein [Niallia nealsonii]PKG23873.1 EAL domain-containing protein [Niallia nealsonii]